MRCDDFIIDDKTKSIGEYPISNTDIITLEIVVVDVKVTLPTGNEKTYSILKNKTVRDLKELIAVFVLALNSVFLDISLHRSQLPLSFKQQRSTRRHHPHSGHRSEHCVLVLLHSDSDSASKRRLRSDFLGYRIQPDGHR